MKGKKRNSISGVLVFVGVSSITAQIILLRVFLSVFNGNELIIGVILANWMLNTGLGAVLGRLFPTEKSSMIVPVLVMLSSLLPILTDMALHFLKTMIVIPGSMTSLAGYFLFSFVLLLPCCLVNGLLFTLLSGRLNGNYSHNPAGNAYSLEAIGSFSGGLTVFADTDLFFDNFTVLALVAIAGTAFGLSLLFPEGKYLIPAAGLAAIAVLLFMHPERAGWNLTKKLYPDQDFVTAADSPYENLVVTRNGRQMNFFGNGNLLFNSDDIISSEEVVHYAMIQHPNPRQILVISGGIRGLAAEIGKYHPENICFVEIDSRLSELGELYAPENKDISYSLIQGDARRMIRKSDAKWDVIISNLPPPSTIQLNRYYSLEFFQDIRDRLNINGVFSLSLASTSDYISKEAGELNSITFNTLRAVFKNVIIVPGNRNYFIASDSPLSLDIATLIDEKGISNLYVNSGYLDDKLLQSRSHFIENSLSPVTSLNRDFTPVSFYQQLKIWLNYFGFNLWIPLAVVIVVLIVLFFTLNPVNAGMMTAGFAASSLEFILIIAFQVVNGYAYLANGILISLFMAGLALGSYFSAGKTARSTGSFGKILLLLSLCCFILPFLMEPLVTVAIHTVFVWMIFTVLVAGTGFLTGSAFSAAAAIINEPVIRKASGLYSIDLIGSAAGILVVSSVIFPLLGMKGTCMLTGMITLAGSLLVYRKVNKSLPLQQDSTP